MYYIETKESRWGNDSADMKGQTLAMVEEVARLSSLREPGTIQVVWDCKMTGDFSSTEICRYWKGQRFDPEPTRAQ